MRTIKHMVLMVMLVCCPIKKNVAQSASVLFYETFTQQELVATLGSEDHLFKLVQSANPDPGSSRIGSCPESAMAELWEYVQRDQFRNRVPEELLIAAGAEAKDQGFPIYALKKHSSEQAFPMPEDLKEVRTTKGETPEDYQLLITFSEKGAVKWASMTRLNKGRDIAMLFKGKVIACPRVREEIKHGKCMISGKFTETEINGLKASFED
jgi:preprotein translocase subunit SecD